MSSTMRLWPAALVAAAALVSAACGGSSAGTPSTAATATTAVATSATAGTTLTLSEKNNQFDKSELKATPGEMTFVVRNEDSGMPHNFHLYRGNDTTGQDMGNTQIELGPGTQTLKLSLAAGTYYYQCDVHPATAFGKLEVK